MNRSKRFSIRSLVVLIAVLAPWHASGQTDAPEAGVPGFTRQDRLRGSVTPERAWWDLLHYDLTLQVFPDTKSLRGSNLMTFVPLARADRMQLDLQPPLVVTRVAHGAKDLKFEREGNVYWIQFASPPTVGVEAKIQIDYEGVPTESKNPPWSGGFSWKKDEKGNPFLATTCQGIGASIWWPNKDHGADEPDRGVDIRVTVPEGLTAVANGRLQSSRRDLAARTRTFHWQVTNPINNYCVNLNIGNYVAIPGEYEGEGGKLSLEYWVLEHQRDRAVEHFKEVPRTLAAFEHWFGKYPFYEDSYKLVTVPYPGMEHQSSVTYGNGFKNGYGGRDLSGTGVGFKFDFIVVHESAHEWFGNNISMRDAADMWIHESFANYAENLFVEYHFSAKEAQDYVIGCRRWIRNDRPIIGTYGVNHEGSGDMYYKGGNMLHTMRQVVNDDAKWRAMLRGLNQQFWHQTVTTKQVEDYVSQATGFDFSRYFDQYLRTIQIPELAYAAKGNSVRLWWGNVVPGFASPVLLKINGTARRVVVSDEPLQLDLEAPLTSLDLDRNFYMTVAAAKEAR
ncbi:MAG: M1 family metallopeptidase [Planctomycetes bacterium]|nr:M1 family metallopeptidase [Planctomycetota bacterium]